MLTLKSFTMGQLLVRQCFGIDIAKGDFTASLCRHYSAGDVLFSDTVTFENSRKGFNQFLRWCQKISEPSVPATYLMEATGIYFEPLAYHLHRIHKHVSVLLPNKVKHYAKSLNIKTKTDAVDARVIARFGTERQHPEWQPPKEIYKKLRELTRLCGDLKKERTVFSNRTRSTEAGESPNSFVLKANNRVIKELDNLIEKCEKEIAALVEGDIELRERFEKLMTIKGIGLTTLAVVIAETQGFALISNRKQLASYAGYDVVQRESGSSVKGKTRISKKGNSRIRAAMHFPALVSCRFNQNMKNDYLRIIEHKTSKMVGATAVQRKLLLLIYTLWKNNDTFKEEM